MRESLASHLPDLKAGRAPNASLDLPPKPVVFHGRENIVIEVVNLLTQPGNVRIAILGAGGMGKTTIALEVLYDIRVVEHFDHARIFVSCEALINCESVIGKLAELIGVPKATPRLQAAVMAQLTTFARTFIVLDNLETVWLSGGTPAESIDDLLGRLAQIPSVSLMITCRGIVLPQSVQWSNVNNATLEPFSFEAALETFLDRAGRQLSAAEEETAKKLLRAVDMMPLAVTLLGQLAQRGTPASELLQSWNFEHSALLQTHGAGRLNSIEVSIEVSISMLNAADTSRESLHLLSACCMLPDGLSSKVFENLRPQFGNIRRARDILTNYALANLTTDRVLKTLSPVRHFVLERYPVQQHHYRALCSIYFEIAKRLPEIEDKNYTSLAAAAAPELENLSSLLLTLVSEPSLDVVSAVIRFTTFKESQQPTATLALALLPHLEPHPRWKADCLQLIGRTKSVLAEYRSALSFLSSATQVYLELDNRLLAARCTREAGNIHRMLHEYDKAETCLEEARAVFVEMGSELGVAQCRRGLGDLMRTKRNHPAAIEHLEAAHRTFSSLKRLFAAAQSMEGLGVTYRDQGDLDSAATHLSASRSAFLTLGHQFHVAQSTLLLGSVRRRQGDFAQAEVLLRDAERLHADDGHRFGLALLAMELGYLRDDQGSIMEATSYFKSAAQSLEVLGMDADAAKCREHLLRLQSVAQD